MGGINWNKTINEFIPRVKRYADSQWDGLGGDSLEFFKVLGHAENSGSYVDPYPDYVGKYQVGIKILEEQDFFRRDGKCLGITDMASLGLGTTAKSQIAQEMVALREFSGIGAKYGSRLTMVKNTIYNMCPRNDKSIYNELISALTNKTVYTIQFYDGTEMEVTFSEAGISAAAHNLGPGPLADLLYRIMRGKQIDWTKEGGDGNGIAFTAWMS